MVDLFLFTGQSNMQGQTGVLPSPNEPAHKSREYRLLTDSLVPLCHPAGENLSADGQPGNCDLSDTLLAAWQGCGSLPPYFCDTYAKASGQEVVAVHAAKGSTTISYWQKGGEAYALLTRKFLAAEKAIGKENVRRRYAVFLQGESDAIEGTSQADYEARLSRFIADLKQDIAIDAFFIIRVARFTEDERDFPILRAQEAVAARGDGVILTRIAGSLLLQPEKYQSYERAHYNNEAFAVLGKVAGENAVAYDAGLPFDAGKEPYQL